MVVLGGGAVSYERGTPVPADGVDVEVVAVARRELDLRGECAQW